MIINYSELCKHEFSLTDIKIIRQKPSYRLLIQKSRICNGFLYIISGSCRYSFDGGEFSAGEGSVIYLPLGSKHTLNVTSPEICFYRLDFTLKIGREIALFSDIPLKITDKAPAECAELLSELESDYGISDNSILRTEKLCRIFLCLEKNTRSKNTARLMPAINFLHENATEKTSCAELAKLCFLGSSRFYNLFKSEFGVTPLEYRDRLLIKRASAMLEAGDISVKEAAFAIGFDNTAYFSRFFKKHTGMSPFEYSKSIERAEK